MSKKRLKYAAFDFDTGEFSEGLISKEDCDAVQFSDLGNPESFDTTAQLCAVPDDEC